MRLETTTGSDSLAGSFGRQPDVRDWVAFALGFVTVALVTIVDVMLGGDANIGGSLVLASFIASLTAGVRGTAAVAVLATAAVILSPLWNQNFGDAAYWVRIGVLLLTGGVAVGAALARFRSLLASRHLELLESIGRVADGSLPLDRTLQEITETLVPETADICVIDAVHDGRVTRMAVRSRVYPGSSETEERLRRRQPSIPDELVEAARGARPESNFVARADDEVLVGIAHDSGEDLEFVRSVGVRSFLTVPLYARGRTIGALTLVTTDLSKRSYSRADLRFAEVLSGRIALALDNAGLFSDLESVERRLDAVMSLIDEGVVVYRADGTFVYANEAMARWLHYDSAEALLAASPQDVLEGVTLIAEDGASVDDPVELVARARGSRSHWRGLVRVNTAREQVERWAMIGHEPILGPGGEVLYGVITLDDVTDVKRAEFGQRLLAETGKLLSSSRDYRETLHKVAELAVPQFAEWCVVSLPADGGILEPVALAHGDPRMVEFALDLQSRYPARVNDDPGAGPVMRGGAPLLLNVDEALLEAVARDDEHLRLMRLLDTGSLIIAPLTAGNKVLGTLTYVNGESARRFDETDLELAVEVAARAGIAVESARIASEEAEVARLLQIGLRPPALPEIPGWATATMYRSAGEVSEVGGDFFDAFRLEGGWMILIGDVVGRGAAAASLTALARHTLRTAIEITRDPLMAVRQLHDALIERGDEQQCTVAAVIIPDSDRDPAAVSVLSAGHPLPLVLSSERVQEVGEPGPLLGAIDDPSWTLAQVELGRGDQLVIYTDGVTDAKGAEERFGDERLHRRLAASPHPQAVVDRVEAALEDFSSPTPGDDAALIAIQRADSAVESIERSARGRIRAVAS